MEKLNQNTSWYRTPAQMAEDDRLNPADVLVYSALLDFCTDSLVCTVGMSELLPRLRCMSRRTIIRSLEHLEQYGYLTRTKTTGEKNTYKLADIIGLKRKPRQQSKPSHTPEEPEQETKQRYGKYQNVLLTSTEFDRLTAEYGTKANSYIERCDSYCQSTGRHYADYNATIRRWIDSDVKKSLPTDDVKRQEFSEIDEYLELVNRFDDLDSTTEATSKPVQAFQHENQETIPLNRNMPKNSIRSDLNGIGYSMPKDNIKRQEFSEIDEYLKLVNRFDD